jgi:hypothetical protein
LYGCDYSEKAIELARSVATAKDLQIDFFTMDILDDSFDIRRDGNTERPLQFSLILDKGTFDAIALHDNGPRNREKYVAKLMQMMERDKTVFVITSCNFTATELKQIFPRDSFDVVGSIKYPVFTFGGSTGTKVTTIAFKLRK